MLKIKKKITRKIKRIFIDSFISSNIKNIIYQEKIPINSEFSFAQEGEDILLSSYCCDLSIVDEGQTGFYVDIGAHHPTRFSNTYLFYLKGWNGINIDAMPGSMSLFNKFRERDINLEIPVSDKIEEVNYYSFKEPAYNTLDSKIAKLRISNNNEIGNVYKIKTRTLESVLDEYLPVNINITFMSIDVEGFDMRVLQSNNWIKYKPKIILIEDESFCYTSQNDSEIFKYLLDENYTLIAKTRRNLLFCYND